MFASVSTEHLCKDGGTKQAVNEQLLISLKYETLTCLYIICKSFILNVDLIDQATQEGPPRPGRLPPLAPSLLAVHPPLPQPQWLATKGVGVTVCPGRRSQLREAHTGEVRPVSSGVWRPAEMPCLCIVLICAASKRGRDGETEGGAGDGLEGGGMAWHMVPG